MKTLICSLVLLLACTQAHGRRLLQDDGCGPDLKVLEGIPDVKEIGRLIVGMGVLPNGVPGNITVFLPNDAGVNSFLTGLPIPGVTIDAVITPGSPLGSIALPKLNSALLYHVVPSGSIEGEMELPTALADVELMAAEGSDGKLTLTDAADQKISVVAGPIQACGATVYVVDKVLLPSKDLLAITDTTKDAAIAALGGAMPAEMA